MTHHTANTAPASRRQWIKTAAATAALAVGAPHVLAQPAAAAYPSRPIKIVVGYAAGGAVDAVARAVGQALSQSMGQPVVIENKPGAGTNIAVKSVIAAEPDGYTLMMAANALAANMALYQPMPFDAEKDLVAISLVGRVPVVLATGAGSGITSLSGLLQAAKATAETRAKDASAIFLNFIIFLLYCFFFLKGKMRQKSSAVIKIRNPRLHLKGSFFNRKMKRD